LALASAPALANGAEHASRFGHMGRGGGFMMFGSLMMIVVVAAIVAIVFVVVRWIGGQSQGESKAALDILRERFARGEIDAAEFEERRRVLDE
jgi:putative membrane protein